MERELLLPLLSAHIGRSLIKPECLKITGLPVQLKADDLLNFRKRLKQKSRLCRQMFAYKGGKEKSFDALILYLYVDQ